jgi:hypothetical protein
MSHTLNKVATFKVTKKEKALLFEIRKSQQLRPVTEREATLENMILYTTPEIWDKQMGC